MNRVLSILSFFIFVSQHQVLAKGANECDQGTDCSNVIDSSGKKNGIEVCKSGKTIRRKVTYKNDVREGLWECFNKDKELIESRVYKSDKINGLKKLWQENIKKFEESEYVDDEVNGFVTTYDTSHSGGQTKISGINKTSFKNGVKHGLQTIYDADGKEIKKFCYNKGQQVALDKEPCLQKKVGELAVSEISKDLNSVKQKSNSKIKTEYFKSGAVKEKFELVSAGDYESYEMYFENAQLRLAFKRVTKSNDAYHPDIYDFSSFTDKGLIKEKGQCAISPSQNFPKDYCPKFSGVESRYNDKDELIQIITYKDGQLNGPAVVFNKKRHREETTMYEKGIKKKFEVKDSKTNQVIESKEYFEDGSEKK